MTYKRQWKWTAFSITPLEILKILSRATYLLLTQAYKNNKSTIKYYVRIPLINIGLPRTNQRQDTFPARAFFLWVVFVRDQQLNLSLHWALTTNCRCGCEFIKVKKCNPIERVELPVGLILHFCDHGPWQKIQKTSPVQKVSGFYCVQCGKCREGRKGSTSGKFNLYLLDTCCWHFSLFKGYNDNGNGNPIKYYRPANQSILVVSTEVRRRLV